VFQKHRWVIFDQRKRFNVKRNRLVERNNQTRFAGEVRGRPLQLNR
jgi:hypothetical protein